MMKHHDQSDVKKIYLSYSCRELESMMVDQKKKKRQGGKSLGQQLRAHVPTHKHDAERN